MIRRSSSNNTIRYYAGGKPSRENAINVTSFLPSSAVPTKDQEKSDNTDDEEREDTTKMETF
jgi:hypothetical protein